MNLLVPSTPPKPLGSEAVPTLLTPELAAKFLALNKRNRTVVKDTLATYVREIRAGRWGDCDSNICISKSGILLNGQHRCLAVVETGISIWVRVVYDMEDPAQHNMDIGTIRRPGVTYGLEMDLDNAPRLFEVAASIGYLTTGRNRIPDGERRAIYERHHRGINWTEEAFGPGRKGHLSSSVRGGFAFAYEGVRKDFAALTRLKEFAAGLKTGENLPGGHPALVLRKTLDQRVKGVRARDTGREITKKVLRAAKAFLDGESLSKLYESGNAAEFFATRLGYVLPK